jgi:hypothetical protein
MILVTNDYSAASLLADGRKAIRRTLIEEALSCAQPPSSH